jgi:hypothetical protein
MKEHLLNAVATAAAVTLIAVGLLALPFLLFFGTGTLLNRRKFPNG